MIDQRRWRRLAGQWLPPQWRVRARCLLGGRPIPRWGNLRRTTPFSIDFGFDRGTPIDRYYIERFLTRHRSRITGRVLEIQGGGYTHRLGQQVSVSHSLDINADVKPTYVCDLAHCETIVPDDAYDCFLLPQTAQHLRELEPAMVNALRVVRPGGSVLATSAGFVPKIPDGPEYARLMVEGWADLAARVWVDSAVEITSYGNCLAAIAALHGLAAEELDTAELNAVDPRYPVLVGVACIKGTPPART